MRRLSGLPWLAVIALSAWATAVAAQQVEVQAEGGPHYVDVPVQIQIVADGFEEQPTPKVVPPEPTGGTLEFQGVSPQVSSSIVIINGNMRQSKEVKFVYRYAFLANAPGDVQIGPFRVSQGSQEHQTRPFALHVASVPSSDRLAVELVLPNRRIYVGERVPVTLRFEIAQGLRQHLEGYTLRVPFFDMSEGFQFLDDPAANGTKVTIDTRAGQLQLVGRAETRNEGGRKFLEISVERTAVPLRAGTVQIPAASVVADEGTRYQRDLFGSRIVTNVRKLRAADRERALEVSPVPLAGRPPSFAGAVGKGFHLDVAADRTVVQVGDPITLTLTLRGDGNLETLGLPPLDRPGLLPGDRFRVPQGDLPGVVDGGHKQFSAVVRVLDAHQQEIPALEYAWFDPETQRFETTRSRPIALSVRPAEVVGANDVLSAAPPSGSGDQPESGSRAVEEQAAQPPAQATPQPSLSGVSGADLAIERDPALLVRDARTAWGGRWLPAGVYAGSVMAVLLALLERRRQDLGPEAGDRRRRIERELRAIRQAAGAPATEGAGSLSRALRRLAAESGDGRDPELDALLGECDACAYAPAALRRAAPLDPQLHRRALALAERLAERAR